MLAGPKHRVLVLDNGYHPLGHITWKQAIDILIDEKADVIEHYEGVFICTATKQIPTPAVLRLKYKSTFKRKRRISYSNSLVFYRDKNTCQYCGEVHSQRNLEIEHVIPKGQGGKTEITNVVAACRPCNGKKGCRTPEQAGMKLINYPKLPEWLPVIRNKTDVPKEWEPYLHNDIGITVQYG